MIVITGSYRHGGEVFGVKFCSYVNSISVFYEIPKETDIRLLLGPFSVTGDR
jgi:hypothetical protein